MLDISATDLLPYIIAIVLIALVRRSVYVVVSEDDFADSAIEWVKWILLFTARCIATPFVMIFLTIYNWWVRRKWNEGPAMSLSKSKIFKGTTQILKPVVLDFKLDMEINKRVLSNEPFIVKGIPSEFVNDIIRRFPLHQVTQSQSQKLIIQQYTIPSLGYIGQFLYARLGKIRNFSLLIFSSICRQF
jgi:hypothetical protein